MIHMKNLKIYFASFMLIAFTNVEAQQTPFSSQYYTNQFVTNPALTGVKGTTNAFLTHRTQWVGIEGAPQTTYFTADGSLLQDKVGLGLVMFSDVTGILSRTGFNANYAYKLQINADNSLRFGLSAGVLNNKIDFAKAIVLDNTDPLLSSQEQTRTSVTADLGLTYIWKSLEVGFAVPQVLGNRVNYQNNIEFTGDYNLSRHYYGSLKYTVDISRSNGITAYPLVMVRSVQGAPLQYDINTVFDWERYGWIGFTYHSDYAVAFSAGVRFKGLSVGYAHNIGTNAIKSYTGRTSEFLLGYTFEKKESDLSEMNLLREEIAQLKANDSIQDSLLLELNNLADSNKIEIEKLKLLLDDMSNDSLEQAKLKAELDKLKDKEDSTQLAIKMAENGISMKTGSASDFSSEGSETKAGYYVIIGAFSNHDNAEVFTKDAKLKGYTTAEIIQNKNNKIYEIVVFKTQDKQEAIGKLDGIKSDYFDVWVLTLE
jgi:type IX secretion system PorP/SprF family membrane protein